MTIKTLTCAMCQAEFAGFYRKKYCSACRKVKTREISNAHKRRRKEQIAEREKASYWQSPEHYRAKSRAYYHRVKAEREAKLQSLLTELANRKQAG